MKAHRLGGIHGVGLLIGIVTLAVFAGGGSSWADGEEFRWDIINIDFATSTLSSGGVASSKAVDGSTITLTGSGTFDTENKRHVSGGGLGRRFLPRAHRPEPAHMKSPGW
jgi:hypothetical protein